MEKTKNNIPELFGSMVFNDEQMRQRLADAIQVDVDQINVKATTTEKLSYEGEGLGITAHAVCLLEK